MTVHYKSAAIARNAKNMIARKQATRRDCTQTSKQHNAIARNQRGMIVRKQAVEQNDNQASTIITGNNKEQIILKFKQQIIFCQT